MDTEVQIQDEFSVVKLENEGDDVLQFSREVKSTFIQLHFCIKGSGKLHFGPHYAIEVGHEKSLLLYNPNQKLPINLSLAPNSKYAVFIISIKVFHSFFSEVAELIHFLDEENKDKKYYLDRALSPSELLVLTQFFNEKIGTLNTLYLKAKVYELLSLYFNAEKHDTQACPFLEDEENVEKIKKAKELVIQNLAEPPTLKKLAIDTGLSLSKLKEGFKVIYGETVFNFLLDYKMEYGRKMLLSKKYNVTEISHSIGYSTPSHFISAFKKKYGTTPKQYIMSLS